MEKLLMWLIELLREIQSRRGKNEKDVQYLCSHLVVSLERYVDCCAAVVGDDGLCCGQPDDDGFHVAQVALPKLEINPHNQEFKLLPTHFMHALVQFPRDIEIANARIEGASEHATPPVYEEAFEERQYQYAELGLKAQALASEMRVLSALPPRDLGEWSVIAYMEQKKASISEYRNRRAEANSKFWENYRATTGGA